MTAAIADPQYKSFFSGLDDNSLYLEHQWAQDTIVAFEQEHGEEGEDIQNLADMLVKFAQWCDVNGLKMSDALKSAAKRYSEETEGTGRQFNALNE